MRAASWAPFPWLMTLFQWPVLRYRARSHLLNSILARALLANPNSKTSNCARPIFFASSNKPPSSRLNKRDEALAAWVLAARLLLASSTQFCCRRSDLGIPPIASAIGSSIRFDSSVHRRSRASGTGPHPRTTSCLNSISRHSRPPLQASPSHCLQNPLSGTAYRPGFPRTRPLSTQLLVSQWSSPAPRSIITHPTTRCVIQS